MLSSLIAYGHKVRRLDLPKGTSPLHCMAISSGYESRHNEVYSWDGLQRGSAPFLVIQHTIVGEGRLDFAGARHRLIPGQTMLLSLPHAHRYWLERGGSWEYFWLVLNGREALRLARDIIAAAGPVLTLTPAQIDRLANACLHLIDSPVLSPGDASGAAYGAMAALHDAAFAAAVPQAASLPPAIARVIAHVDGHLAQSLRVEQLAAVSGLSRAHFVRQFTAATGVAPSAFVLARRLDHAERLLLATDLPVDRLAALAGFADANYLAKVFRRARGLSPTEFRHTRRPDAAAPVG